MRILIADDDLMMRQFLAAILEGQGHEVIHAGDGEEAWEKLQAESTRIVITDWQMPRLDGIELCRRIRQREKDGASYTYVIIVTSNNEKDQVSEGLSAGADDFVVKPFDPTELRWRVHSGERVLHLEDALAERIDELDRTAAELAKANKTIQSELEAAGEVQLSLVPTAQVNDALEFASVYKPCDSLGGDCMNVIPINDRYVGIWVADVCGHGIKASLLAVSIHRVFTPVSGQDSIVAKHFDDGSVEVTPPSKVLQWLNQRFPMDMESCQYFTMLYGVLDTETGHFAYSSAGHPPPIFVPVEKDAREITGSGLPIGIMEDAEFDDESIDLIPGERLCIFTDGITEAAQQGDGDQFGVERLSDQLGRSRKAALGASIDSVIGRVDAWHGEFKHADDRTMLLFEFIGRTAKTHEESLDDILRTRLT